jgi:cobalt-zinc-cadmium efflux system membrane fusion protein
MKSDASPDHHETKPHDHPGDPAAPHGRPGVVFFLLLIAVAAFAGYRMFLAQPAVAPKVDTTPQLVREGQRIRIPEGSPLRGKLTVGPVTEQEIERTLALPAVVEPDPARLAKVMTPLSGRVTTLNVQLGQRVDSGQALLVVDSSDLGTAYSDYDKGKILFDLARKNRDRIRDLAKIGGAAIKDQQQAETDYVTAEAELQRADAHLKQIGVPSETPVSSRLMTVTAPIAGSIIDLQVSPGSFWNDATAALMTIADLKTVWVTANVPEKDTALVTQGQAVEVTFPAYPGEVFRGAVLFVSDVLDTDTRRTKVRISFANPDIRLKPGMFATANFLAPKQTVTTVPTSALILKNDADLVFVEVAPWTFEARRVETGAQQSDRIIVRSGVRPGDRVVVKGGVLLND